MPHNLRSSILSISSCLTMQSSHYRNHNTTPKDFNLLHPIGMANSLFDHHILCKSLLYCHHKTSNQYHHFDITHLHLKQFITVCRTVKSSVRTCSLRQYLNKGNHYSRRNLNYNLCSCILRIHHRSNTLRFFLHHSTPRHRLQSPCRAQPSQDYAVDPKASATPVTNAAKLAFASTVTGSAGKTRKAESRARTVSTRGMGVTT
ncbi:hypothetical protein DE146DRAFT_218512 [Phaeosphaeria sp. MPI-PUGE-AT-0046c]|nr:hypothetical protein DE146DRAFT_218512 [Phaeosphaeria sp. MPI-PUGE-AT-0046c]